MHLSEPWHDLPAGQWTELTAPDDYPDSRTATVNAFCRAILDNTEPPVPGPEGRRSLEIARGAYLSMQRGCVVTFPVQE